MKTLAALIFLLGSTAEATPVVQARVTFTAVDRASGAPHLNDSYGAIEFHAQDEAGNTYFPERDGSYSFTKAGIYTLGGTSIHNFCYSDQAKVLIDEHTVSIQVRLYVSCE